MRTEHTSAADRARPDGGLGTADGELDDLTDEELALALAETDPTRPSEHQLAGGAPRGLAWLLTIGGAIGLWAAVMLVLSERAVRIDPDTALACDLNPLVGCGDFIVSWQAAALGVPNALLGTIAFTLLTVTGVVLLGGARLQRWYWVGLMVGVVLAAGVITWFQFQSMAVLRGLCPYCMVVWAVTIPIVVNVLARGFQAGHVPAPEGLRRFLVRERWLVVAAWYLVLVGLIVGVFWDQWLLLL
ncbi:vitamin K epoxide reductase family protein [Georgenia sp. MJ206]|uniref:vitamin K epoxide reductase family protein n=1 Tax=Georgenia wangjunii TaxID=3117730 RepID=UPI002F265602